MKHSPGQLYQRTFRKTKQINLVIDHCKYHNKKQNVWQTYGFRDPWLFNSLTDCYETGMHSVSKFSLARFLSSHWHTHRLVHTLFHHTHTLSLSLSPVRFTAQQACAEINIIMFKNSWKRWLDSDAWRDLIEPSSGHRNAVKYGDRVLPKPGHIIGHLHLHLRN